MPTPSLRIKTSKTEWTISSTPARIEIKQKMLRFRRNSSRVQMQISSKRPRMYIDWSGVMGQLDLRKPQQWMEHQYAQAKRNTVDAIARIVQRGNHMGAIHKQQGGGPSPISQLHTFEPRNQPAQLSMIGSPVRKPDITWDQGDLQINWSTPTNELEWDSDFRPEVAITPHTVTIQIRAYPRVDISVDYSRVQSELGKKLRTKL